MGQFFAVEVVACGAPDLEPVGRIDIDATMPAHGHGMNYRPAAAQAGPGHYRFTGLMLHMPGTWRVTFDLFQGGRRTRLTRRGEAQAMRSVLSSRPSAKRESRDLGPRTPRLPWRSWVPDTSLSRISGMTAFAAIASLIVAVATGPAMAAEPSVTFTADERAAILAHGPWPPPMPPDPSNRVSGKPEAIALGRRLFFDQAPLQGRPALLRQLPRPGQGVRRRPRAEHRRCGGGPQRPRARQPAPQPLVRLGRRRRQPVGAEHPSDPRCRRSWR